MRTETVVAVVDTGAFQDPRSLNEWWRIRPGYGSPVVDLSDNDYAKQWPLEIINAREGWAISTGEEIVIAVIDTGVDLDHPDLEGKLLVDLGKSFIDQAPTPDDDHGHGTHVAGIAAAATDNSLGIAGVGWDASILPLKVLDRTGSGTLADVAAAIDYAADLGADVINLSLGPESGHSVACDQFLQEEIDEAYAGGAVIVAAAGNNGGRIEVPPANCDHVLGVAATTREDTHPSYSASGSHVSVAAPGGTYDCTTCTIYSTIRGGSYGRLAGTSMATPHVSGLAALILDRYPSYTPDHVASAILDNALDIGIPGYDEIYGCGRIDAYAALSAGAHAAWRASGGPGKG
jgi:subtilisin family serine protease